MNNLTIKDLTYAAILAALTSVLSYVIIPLPFSPVPIVGQNLGVMLAGIILTTKQASLSMITYLLLGMVLPVFAGGQSGPGVLFGPTGGYLFSYVLAVIIISELNKRFNKNNNKTLLGCYVFIGGIVIVHIIGSIWLGAVNQLPLREAFMLGSIPFIPGDMIKLVLAVILGEKIRVAANIK